MSNLLGKAGQGRPSTRKEKAIKAVQEDVVVAEKTKRFNVDIPETLHTSMKIQAAKEGVNLNTLTKRLFNEYLSKVSSD